MFHLHSTCNDGFRIESDGDTKPELRKKIPESVSFMYAEGTSRK